MSKYIEYKVQIKDGQIVGIMAKDVNDAIEICAEMYNLPAGCFKVVG